MSVQQEKFKEIADNIREKTGTTDLIKPSEFASKIADVYEAGKQAEYDAFWDAFQKNGTRTNYDYTFRRWENGFYNPKYPITIASGIASYNATNITDTKVPIVVSTPTMTTTFANSVYLVTIPILDVSSVTTSFDRIFSSCNKLANLTIVGTINANGFVVSDCKNLTHDSLMSIITALADKTQDTSGTEWVCTLGTDNLNKLTDAEKAVATEKGWILA